MIKAPNGTIIHQRTSGSAFTLDDVFGSFCPISNCPDLGGFSVTITMTDAFQDGWEGTILGIRQGGVVKGTFGNAFTSGSSSGPISFNLDIGVEAQIIVTQLGNYT